jgi:hypothetical protein
MSEKSKRGGYRPNSGAKPKPQEEVASVRIVANLKPAEAAEWQRRGRTGWLRSELQNPTTWQPIETAPADGTVILGYREGKIREAHRVPRDDCEMWVFGGLSGSAEFSPQVKPTHWKPLPEMPLACQT